MKKNIFYSLLLIAVAGALASCNSGSASSGATTDVATTPQTPPAGSTIIASTPVAINTTDNTISVPGAVSYQTWTVPSSVIDDIVASGSNVHVQISSAGMLMATATKLYWMVPAVQASVQKTASNPAAMKDSITTTVTALTLTEDQRTTVTSLITNQSNGTTGIKVVYDATLSTLFYIDPNTPTTITEVDENSTGTPPAGTTSTITPSSTCSFTSSDTAISVISLGSFGGSGTNSTYLGLGTNAGTVCLGNLGSGTATPTPSSIAWTNLSNQAPQSRTIGNYTKGQLNALAFVGSNDGTTTTPANTYYGFWSVVGSAPAAYRVSGAFSNTTPVASAFWKVTISGTQTQLGGSTNTFTAGGGSSVPTNLPASYQSCTGAGGSFYIAYINSGDTDKLQIYGLKNGTWGLTTTILPGASSGFVLYPPVDTNATCTASSATNSTSIGTI